MARRPAPGARPHDLLPERALDGDADAIGAARRRGLRRACSPRTPRCVETLAAYLERTGSLEGAARELFVHPNTVRYRLRRVADVTGLTPTVPRDAWSLRLALALGRLAEERDLTLTSRL